MTKTETAMLAAKTKVLKALAHPARLWMVQQLEGGKQVFYSLKVPCVLNFMHCVEAVIKKGREE
ncbi:MAG TPA: hypothetical protein PKM57_05315 [Kiritimatiellia bacterium]|nr:hypothetical protein [Kiritimatiellia bacterium]HPS06488.1 hypothetical protein [Kiritimatiellia bacterium]